MIRPDSSVTTVLGDSKKRDKIVKNLHIETVGDLLHHFPRRYVETGKLTKVDDLEVGQGNGPIHHFHRLFARATAASALTAGVR